MSASHDVVIVGAGPAGSTLAWKLAAAGLDVLLMDKRSFPRDKTCAGWVTPAVMQSLAIDLQDYGRANTLQPIHRFRVGLVDGAEPLLTAASDTPLSWGIRRCEFDHYLLARADCEVLQGSAVKQLQRTVGGWRINDAIDTRLLVGAGGHFCPVARALGADLGKAETAVTAQEVEFRMSRAQAAACPCDPAVPELYFCPDLKGYGWIFRKGEYLNVGLGKTENHRLADQVQHFCDGLVRAGRLPADLPAKFKGHAYLLYAHAGRPLSAAAALTIGDAAGLAYTRSGEGIRPAVESALLAADTIIAAEGNYSASALAAYAEAVSARFGARGPQRASPARERLKAVLAPHLMASRWFASRVVVDRWFLHRHQPALA